MGPPPLARVAVLMLAVAALATGVAGGIARLGGPVVLPAAAAWHGALMVTGFLGTVIGLERAVALGARWALAGPVASGLGTVLVLAGAKGAGLWLWVAAPLLLLGASLVIVRRQPQAHTILLAVAAGAWFVANAAFAFGAPQLAPAWWFAFLVLTIAAERLEMTRLMPRRPAAHPLFIGAVAWLLAAAAAGAWDPAVGRVAFGLALVALAAWLAAFDIARRTIRTEGFARYAAVALLAGYAWLAVGGLAWALAPAMRDLALHALGLGFVFSMIFAHAPLIVPVIARRPMRFGSYFYLPLALLHATLLARVVLGAAEPGARLWGGILNAAAIGLFLAFVLYSVFNPVKRGTADERR